MSISVSILSVKFKCVSQHRKVIKSIKVLVLDKSFAISTQSSSASPRLFQFNSYIISRLRLAREFARTEKMKGEGEEGV